VEASAGGIDAPFRAHLAAGELRRAGEWLVQRHAGEVLGLCAAMVRDRSAAEDLTQDVFGRAFAGLGEFRGEASARTWLLAIARNRCLDHLRRARRDPWAGARPDEIEPDDHADDAPLPTDRLLRRDEIEAALEALVEGDRALVVLRFRHGLEYPELAAAFGLREGTVRMRISRALSRMRAALLAREADGMAAREDSLGAIDDEVTPVAPPRGAAAPAPRRAPPPGRSAPPAMGPPAMPAAPPSRRPSDLPPARPSTSPYPPPARPGAPMPMPPAYQAQATRAPATWAEQVAAALREGTSAASSIHGRLMDLVRGL
jgi:RNA polymerase sigma-70 factor (ECF subfamily)